MEAVRHSHRMAAHHERDRRGYPCARHEGEEQQSYRDADRGNLVGRFDTIACTHIQAEMPLKSGAFQKWPDFLSLPAGLFYSFPADDDCVLGGGVHTITR